MENHNNTYQQPLNHGSSALGISEQELKNRYDMNTEKTSHKYFASLLEIGRIVLGSTENDITTLFRPFEMCLTEYRFGKITKNMLELQLEGATLTCFFSESEICNLSILFGAAEQHSALYPLL